MTRKHVSFAVVDGNPFDVDSDTVELDSPMETENGIIVGNFSYESEPAFGSATSVDGAAMYDPVDGLFAVAYSPDRPKPDSVFRNLDDETPLTVDAPQYPAEASHHMFRNYGFNGYTVSFRSDLRDYSVHSSYQYIEPEERAKERAMHDRFTQAGDDLVDEVTEELIDDGKYVASMDMVLDEADGTIRFSSPMRFSSIEEDNFGVEMLIALMKRAKEMYRF